MTTDEMIAGDYLWAKIELISPDTVIRVPDDGQKRVAMTRPEFEGLAYYFFDLGVNGHMRQHYDHQARKHLFDEDLRDSKICEVFGEEYIP